MNGTRRDFLIASASMTAAHTVHAVPLDQSARPSPVQQEFLFGADVYPELQTRAEWNRMLDHFGSAHMNVVRVSESSWGNLETAPGKFNFDWLRNFLDDLDRRQMKAILGTSTYIPPQWLVAAHPEILVQLLPGLAGDPMSRKSPCLNHPLYRDACRRYITAIAREFKDHVAVIGWQLDNEIEAMVHRICYNPACERAWRQWLEKTYRTPQEFNRRLDLVSWGMKIDSFNEVPQPRPSVEDSGEVAAFPGSAQSRRGLPALSLANFHFERDVILGFLAEQASILRAAGAHQWMLTDWNTVWPALADDPNAQKFMSVAGLNYYQPSADNLPYWADLAWHQDMHRSAYGVGHFITTETRFGVAGQTQMWDPAPSQEQFLMWGLEAAAFGSSALLYWSGNRWRGGHWPHWGGLLDWSGQPEKDFGWAVELGGLYEKWGPTLLANPVKASAAILTDFDQRTALQVYPHVPSSQSIVPECFDALHRLGIGVDTVNAVAAENIASLRKYALLVIPAATALDNATAVAALQNYVREGGVLVITPFTAYMDGDGVFRGDGFGANLAELTGTLVRTVRWMGSPSQSGKREQEVQWRGTGLSRVSPVGFDGFVEYLEVRGQTQVIATFKSDQNILDGGAAATRRQFGKGTVIKLGFWPKDDSFSALLQELVPPANGFFTSAAPPGVLAVPRADDSLFVVNTTGKEQLIEVKKTGTDRLSKNQISGRSPLKPYQVLWLE